jgi:predicted MFS family arabinose efflux permease
MLFTAMAAATFSISSVSIMASSIIEDLAISREQLGLVATVTIMLAAVLSPRAGHVVDRIGGRNSFVGVFLFGGVAFGVMGAAVAYWVLLVGGVVAAVSQSLGNPSTNKLIALHLPQGRRGFVTGIKQSGVQAASFVGGLLLPIGASTIGWRATMVVASVLTISLVLPARAVVPEDRPRQSDDRGRAAPLPPSTGWLAVYGSLLGFAGASTFFVPLFAEEAVGFSRQEAGLAAAVVGLLGFVGRIVWARFAERGDRFRLALGAVALISILAMAAFLASTTAPVLLWVAALVVGVSSGSWNSVAMLAVMHDAGAELAGRASGRVMFGFLIGLGIAPPVYGRTVDVTGSYTLMWWMAVVAYTAAFLLVVAWSRSVAATRRANVA